MRFFAAIIGLSTVFGSLSVGAEVRHAVSPITDLSCMSLNISEAHAMDPSFIVHVRASPANNSPDVGEAGSIILARHPAVERNGFVAVVLFNGRPGWISKNDVKPWVSPSGNGQSCIPSRMSDGSIGFAFR